MFTSAKPVFFTSPVAGNEPPAASRFFNDAAEALRLNDRETAIDMQELIEYSLSKADPLLPHEEAQYRIFCQTLGLDSAYYRDRWNASPAPAPAP